MKIEIDNKVPAYKSYAAERTRGLYNVDAEDGRRFRLVAELPTEDDDWQIGVVVGPSGSGKSSIMRKLTATIGPRLSHPINESEWFAWEGITWPRDTPIIEVLSALGEKGYARATASLAAVGLGSVPSWLRPYRVLSTGEQFRADMARLLLDRGEKVVLDEFTSVLDRTVAKVAAGAFAKSFRRQEGRQIVLFTCHYDILDWVQPDWVIDTAGGEKLAGEDERKVVVARKGDFHAATDHARYKGDRVGTLEC